MNVASSPSASSSRSITRPGARLLSAAAVLLAATTLAACGSSSEESGTAPAQAGGSGPQGAASTSNAPSGIQTRTCVEKNLVPPRIIVTGVTCSVAQTTVAAWQGKASCHLPEGASRYSCTVPGKLRCLGATTDRGISVVCSSPRASIAFIGRND